MVISQSSNAKEYSQICEYQYVNGQIQYYARGNRTEIFVADVCGQPKAIHLYNNTSKIESSNKMIAIIGKSMQKYPLSSKSTTHSVILIILDFQKARNFLIMNLQFSKQSDNLLRKNTVILHILFQLTHLRSLRGAFVVDKIAICVETTAVAPQVTEGVKLHFDETAFCGNGLQ